METRKLIQNIQVALLLFDRVLFVSHGKTEILSLIGDYKKKNLQKSALIFLGNNVSASFPADMEQIRFQKEELVELQKFYYTYEFSDKFMILSLNCNFGTIWNYVKTGFLTPEEALAALLD